MIAFVSYLILDNIIFIGWEDIAVIITTKTSTLHQFNIFINQQYDNYTASITDGRDYSADKILFCSIKKLIKHI